MNNSHKRLLVASGFVLLLFFLFISWDQVSVSNSILSAPAAPTPELLGVNGMITYYQMAMADGTALAYGVVLPENQTTDQRYPVLLALPPGPQTREMVEFGISGYWGTEALNRGWIVVSPIAPNDRLFFQGSEQYLPEFMERIAAVYSPEGGKFHLSGISNGGISAFRIATTQPESFHDMIVAPGLPHEQDFEQLDQLAHLPVSMFVGELDTGWVEPMQQTADRLQELGGKVSLEIVPTEGHVIQSLSGGKRLFDIMEANR
ncbi:MAG: hypothetical protein GY796_16215 [Chloroflexi bacterium]|nr:hypothetical protein [Chloroflexota bacterium]